MAARIAVSSNFKPSCCRSTIIHILVHDFHFFVHCNIKSGKGEVRIVNVIKKYLGKGDIERYWHQDERQQVRIGELV